MSMIKKSKLLFLLLALAAAAVFIFLKIRSVKTLDEEVSEIKPDYGSIEKIISTTGTVLPKNRLEIKPPVSGRVESVLVKEGDMVKVGQTLAWMSSTERAALLDAARGQGEEKFKYWEEAYKPIALLAPIDAEVIVATTQPGQTVTTADAVVVLSDQLIVRAQVDETDIGKIQLDQAAYIALDAYPDNKVKASVDHIYFESQTVNNVTIYEADLAPDGQIPSFFRSGMNATVDFIESSSGNSLIIPLNAVFEEDGQSYVWVKGVNGAGPLKRQVDLGASDDKNTAVLSGLSPEDTLIIREKKYELPKASSSGSNPFMPSRNRNQGKQK